MIGALLWPERNDRGKCIPEIKRLAEPAEWLTNRDHPGGTSTCPFMVNRRGWSVRRRTYRTTRAFLVYGHHKQFQHSSKCVIIILSHEADALCRFIIILHWVK